MQMSMLIESSTKPLDAYMESQIPLCGQRRGNNNSHEDFTGNVEGVIIEGCNQHDSDDDHEDGDGGDVCKVRGISRPNWALNGPEVLKFNKKGQALEPDEAVGRWATYLGRVAVEYSLLPIDATDWPELVRKKKLDEVWNMVKERSATNKRNRSKRRSSHVIGSTTFAVVRHKFKKKNGVAPDRCTMFELSYTRSNGKPVDDMAAKVLDEMRERIDAIKEKKKEQQLPEMLTDSEINEVYASVLGLENHNHVRGFGIGVRQAEVSGVLTKRIGVRLKVQALRESYENEIEEMKKEGQDKEHKLREDMKQLKLTVERQQVMMMKILEANHLVSGMGQTMNGVPRQQPVQSDEDVYRPNLSFT